MGQCEPPISTVAIFCFFPLVLPFRVTKLKRTFSQSRLELILAALVADYLNKYFKHVNLKCGSVLVSYNVNITIRESGKHAQSACEWSTLESAK